jgi:hypothetical protein
MSAQKLNIPIISEEEFLAMLEVWFENFKKFWYNIYVINKQLKKFFGK